MKISPAFFAIAGVLALCSFVNPANAQLRPGWNFQVDTLGVYQGRTNLSGGGAFTSNRQFLRGSGLYSLGDGAWVGLSASFGRFEYNFSDATNQPWSGIRDTRVAIPVSLRVGETARVFFSPGIRWDYEEGASASDGRTYGVFAGVSWELSDTLTIGPAFGAYTQLEEGGPDVFPALLIDWDITDRLNLSTSSGLGATSGPGLTLGYELSDSLRLSLTGRSERVRFRLGDSAIVPGGVAEDRSLPVVVGIAYEPNPGISISAFAGAEFDGELALGGNSGNLISRQSYETAPLVGFAARLRF